MYKLFNKSKITTQEDILCEVLYTSDCSSLYICIHCTVRDVWQEYRWLTNIRVIQA